jgi:hypothetical protein
MKVYFGARPIFFSSNSAGALNREQEVSDPLKVAIICHFRGIDGQVLIFDLEMAKRAFPAEICPLEMVFLSFSAF